MTGPLTDENGMIAGTVADVAAPAEWAMKAAVSAFDHPLPTDSIMLSVASAIEAAANAARERAESRIAVLQGTLDLLHGPLSIAALEGMAMKAEAERDAIKAAFKNFHRMLCDRFGYTHDAVDWQRDQVSLMEWIAAAIRKGPDHD